MYYFMSHIICDKSFNCSYLVVRDSNFTMFISKKIMLTVRYLDCIHKFRFTIFSTYLYDYCLRKFGTHGGLSHFLVIKSKNI